MSKKSRWSHPCLARRGSTLLEAEKGAKKQAPKGTCFSVGFSGLLVQIGRLQRFRGEGDAGQSV